MVWIYEIFAFQLDMSYGSTPDSKVHGAYLGPTGPRWAPSRPHELCYLGIVLKYIVCFAFPTHAHLVWNDTNVLVDTECPRHTHTSLLCIVLLSIISWRSSRCIDPHLSWLFPCFWGRQCCIHLYHYLQLGASRWIQWWHPLVQQH